MNAFILAGYKIPDKPLDRVNVTITRNSTTEPDTDNNYASCKYIIDALVKYKIILEDNPRIIRELKVNWKKAKRGHGFIELTILEV